ncbi:hypothetical protein [Streptomyces sp. NPDC049915]|uniref:hypothetical protein n=1 Tax=Streptomyces sp. NPDC049915 TaxID=3155510 RepID=UPI00343E0749
MRLSSPAAVTARRCEVAVHVRPSARHDQSSPLPTQLTHARLRPPGTTPVTRGVVAAVLAVAALVTAANACPAKAASHPTTTVQPRWPGHP